MYRMNWKVERLESGRYVRKLEEVLLWTAAYGYHILA